MEAKITGCKDAFHVEVALLSTQLEEEWETGRRDKEERRKTTKKVGESVEDQDGCSVCFVSCQGCRLEHRSKMSAETERAEDNCALGHAYTRLPAPDPSTLIGLVLAGCCQGDPRTAWAEN